MNCRIHERKENITTSVFYFALFETEDIGNFLPNTFSVSDSGVEEGG